MAKTLLDGVNDALKRIGAIQSNLTSLTDTAIQDKIDKVVSIWNEAIQQLYVLSDNSFPKEQAELEVTLADGQREYPLASDNEQLIFPGLDETNGDYIWHYPGGYDAMRRLQNVPSQYTGLPQFAVISPITGNLRFDTTPTSTEAGRVYKFPYDKTLSYSAATDTFPFSDAVYQALVPVVHDTYRLDNNNEPLAVLFASRFAQAARLLRAQKIPL